MSNFKNRPNQCIISDGKEYWISRSVAVVALVNVITEDGKSLILINKRGKGTPDYQGYWNLPCGYLDWDETGLDAAIREVYEETGLDIIIYPFQVSGQPIHVSTTPRNNKQNVSLYYKFTAKVDDITFESMLDCLNSSNSEHGEVEEIKFIDINDVDKYMFCFNHADRIKELI